MVDDPAVLEQHRAVAEALDRGHVVGDEDDRPALVAQAVELVEALLLEAASPTASTSSISSTSASVWTMSEKASRTCIPEE